jgi:hypothetical protein
MRAGECLFLVEKRSCSGHNRKTDFDPQVVFGSFIGLAYRPRHRPRDGNVVSFLHCMNDPQPEGHMASYIGRRKFLARLGGAAAWPLAGLNESLRKIFRAEIRCD